VFSEKAKGLIARTRDPISTRNLVADLLNFPADRLLALFGVTRWEPREVHALKDQVFFDVVTELSQSGWNCDAPAFGEGNRDTLLMETARRGFVRTSERLLEGGAEANYNNRGYGASTPLMCASDPEIMRHLLDRGADPLAVNALDQTDFTYKLFKGLTPGARHYLYNTDKIPLQPLLANFRACVLSRASFPYEPMYPLCLLPVVPVGYPCENIVDQLLIDNMLRGRYIPFSSKALRFELTTGLSVWRHVKRRLMEERSVSPALAVGCMACMAKLEECRKSDDLAFLEAYVEKPLPREPETREKFSKAVFVYLLFSLSSLPAGQILRWLMLLGRLLRQASQWMDFWGEEPLRVVNSLLETRARDSHILHELATLQALLAMRVNVAENFGEFQIPDALAGGKS
jgi:hypothetical protein